jgi:hypothetical protein
MKIWLQSNGDALFQIGPSSYVRINNIPFYGIGHWNKRYRIKEVDVISLASSFEFSQFTAMYYLEKIVYWHELRELIKLVCV